jgi:hypothetical protein
MLNCYTSPLCGRGHADDTVDLPSLIDFVSSHATRDYKASNYAKLFQSARTYVLPLLAMPELTPRCYAERTELGGQVGSKNGEPTAV